MINYYADGCNNQFISGDREIFPLTASLFTKLGSIAYLSLTKRREAVAGGYLIIMLDAASLGRKQFNFIQQNLLHHFMVLNFQKLKFIVFAYMS